MAASNEGSSAVNITNNETDNSDEPPSKKVCTKPSSVDVEGQNIDEGESSQGQVNLKLERRLSNVFCCNVCLDLSTDAIYQCPHGHLMCAGCFHHLLADGRLKNEVPSCPSCRIEITESSCTRNLAVEKAISELPTPCRFCKSKVPRFHVAKHERDKCPQRLVACKYSKIGCHWEGSFTKKQDHEKHCAQARKTGVEILESLEKMSEEENKRLNLYKSIMSLLSSQRTMVHDLQLRPKRTDEFIPELYYDTSRFSAFGQDWVIRAQVVGNEKSLKRGFTFQLVQLTKCNMFVKFIFVRSPFGDLEVQPVIFQHEFSTDSQEACEQDLPLSRNLDINKVLSAKLISIRIIMFQTKNSL